MSTQPDHPVFDQSCFEQHLPQIYRSILKEFRRAVALFTRMHLLFSFLLVAELLLFIPFGAKSTIAALILGGLFITIFSYIILLFYFQAKKPEQFLHLREQFLQSCRQHILAPPGVSQHHLSIAEALVKLVSYLQDFESNFYRLPSGLQIIAPLFNAFSFYCYWEDVFKIKKLLLEAAIEEHLHQVRITPTDLEVHASLANLYVSLSKLYRDVIAQRGKKAQGLAEQFHFAGSLAIEELKILNYYAPNDPWVHEQLALGYSRLDMPEEELKEVEILSMLRPQDTDILYRLGMLYFQRGMNAKGLKIYQDLLQSNFKKAEILIASYGSAKFSIPLC